MSPKKRQRLEKRKEGCEMNTHHIIPKCRSDLFECLNDADNLYRRKKGPHRAHHNAHGVRAPHETLESYEFFTKVMSKKARILFDTLLNLPVHEFYDEKYLKWSQ